jgi:hypothetical protein
MLLGAGAYRRLEVAYIAHVRPVLPIISDGLLKKKFHSKSKSKNGPIIPLVCVPGRSHGLAVYANQIFAGNRFLKI